MRIFYLWVHVRKVCPSGRLGSSAHIDRIELHSIVSCILIPGSLRNILHQCSYKIDLIPGQKENRPAKMTPESPDFGFACFAILV
ncbi:hypothetical protein T06_16882 [Trichinella sp. T6]|nr:hypothetical protein T06_16882 [Trichinella sp. T6]